MHFKQFIGTAFIIINYNSLYLPSEGQQLIFERATLGI